MTFRPTLWSGPTSLTPAAPLNTRVLPDIAYLTSGHILITWRDNGADTTQPGQDIIGRIRHNSDDNAISAAAQMNVTSVGDNEGPGVIGALPDGGFVVAYLDRGATSTAIRFDIYGPDRAFLRSGTVVAPVAAPAEVRELRIADATSGLAQDGFALVWEQVRLVNAGGVTVPVPEVKFQSFDVEGNPVAAAVTVEDFKDDQAVAHLSTGRYVVATLDEVQNLNDDVIRLTTYTRAGVVDTSANAIDEFLFGGAGRDLTEIGVAGLRVAGGNGNAEAAVWAIENLSGNDRLLMWQVLPGNVVGSPGFVSISPASHNVRDADIVALRDGGWFIAWSADTTSNGSITGSGIFGRRFNADGSLAGTLLTVATGAGFLRAPALSLAEDGRILVAWDAGGTMTTAIYDPREALILGTAGNDHLMSRRDSSTVDGLTGDDKLFGREGDDSLRGSSGFDRMSGGDGNDRMSGGTENDRMEGDGGNDTLNGDAGNDSLHGGVGNDRLEGGDGDDRLTGHGGDDRLDGGAGNDTLFAGVDLTGARNTLFGGLGDDTLESTAGNDTLSGDDGHDTLTGFGGDDTLFGGAGNDRMNSGTGNDILRGGTGADSLQGFLGDDTADYSESAAGVTVRLFNGTGTGGDAEGDVLAGVEHVTGSAHTDNLIGADLIDNRLAGGDGNDFLAGLSGNDTLVGDLGNDTLRGGAGADSLSGGDGTGDIADYTGSATGVTVRLFNGTGTGGDAEGDVLSGIEALIGSALGDNLIGADLVANSLRGGDGNDFLAGLSGNDTLSGDLGNDTLRGGAGADSLQGGDGTGDIADYTGSASVTVRLFNGTGQSGDAQGDTLAGIEHVTGSANPDSLIGADLIANSLDGGAGGDFLAGLSGNDTLVGGAGNDTLDGGAGNDVFVFGAGAGQDRVTLFQDGQDRVDLTGALTFAGLTETAIAGGVRLTITASPGDAIDLLGVTTAQVDAGDFI